jgi:hypothetical protein
VIRWVLAFLLFSPAISAADVVRHDFRVRNFSGEPLAVRVVPAAGFLEGATSFRVLERDCVESFLVFRGECRYEFRADGADSGRPYGSVEISGCAPAGIDVEADGPPQVSGAADCGDWPFFPCPEDSDDTEVFVSCFIGTAMVGNAGDGPGFPETVPPAHLP